MVDRKRNLMKGLVSKETGTCKNRAQEINGEVVMQTSQEEKNERIPCT